MRRFATVVLLAGLTACGGGGHAAQGPACGPLPTADPSAKLPTGFPDRGNQVLYQPETEGKTQIVWALVHETDFVHVRDDYVNRLRAAGWHLDGTDQEAVEAEAHFSKNPPLVTASIKVAPLCKGYITIRYRASF